MSSIPIADSDIVGWTPEYLALRRVPHLRTLIQRLKLKFPDVDAEARPDCTPLSNKAPTAVSKHVAVLFDRSSIADQSAPEASPQRTR